MLLCLMLGSGMAAQEALTSIEGYFYADGSPVSIKMKDGVVSEISILSQNSLLFLTLSNITRRVIETTVCCIQH